MRDSAYGAGLGLRYQAARALLRWARLCLGWATLAFEPARKQASEATDRGRTRVPPAAPAAGPRAGALHGRTPGGLVARLATAPDHAGRRSGRLRARREGRCAAVR